MISKKLKQILLWGGGISCCLVVILAVHIYMVTRPKAPGANTRIMARIDIRQDISQEDANKIAAWLYQQQGVDRVMISADNNIAVFTYFPVKANADDIVQHFKTAFHYPAQRYVPDEAELKNGCPAMAQSFSARISGFIKYIF
ncbi:hypothetical protein [Chitinophaga rhizophila]|uniref:Heavy-metal-associated domain-containing protein n=1 Tax=Chitinophaga rhizophila TaxID=2866212 RepID=A0ABS7G5Y8_9BACT|nr:hypothetical protein [Chitinophaga rhizophila]MBW8682816.1 hypothetical protein [Chitinophaga rhizophila]